MPRAIHMHDGLSAQPADTPCSLSAARGTQLTGEQERVERSWLSRFGMGHGGREALGWLVMLPLCYAAVIPRGFGLGDITLLIGAVVLATYLVTVLVLYLQPRYALVVIGVSIVALAFAGFLTVNVSPLLP